MRWLPGTKTVRAASLKLPEGYDLITRMAQPHVIELAGSIRDNGGVPGNFPWVHWPSLELTAGGDRFAALVRNNGGKLRGASPDTDLTIEVRCFEGEPADIERLRRHENIHRRQDRDRWLREQVEEEARELAAKRVAVAGQPDIPAKLDPPSLPLPGLEADPGAFRHKWVQQNPNGTSCDVAGEREKDWALVTCPACRSHYVGFEGEKAPPWAPSGEPASASVGDQLCICGHAFEKHGEGGLENCSDCVCELFEVAEEPAPQVGMADEDPCATCGHRADEHELDGCQHQRCKCKELVPGQMHRYLDGDGPCCGAAGVLPKLVVGTWDLVTCPACLDVGKKRGLYDREEAERWAKGRANRNKDVAVTKADKAQARKNVAAREGTTPAAVKQAEQRDRQRKGETKPTQQTIADSGSPVAGLTTDQHLQLSAYLDGFARGADHRRPGKRHAVDPATHVQWKRGYDAGLAAARAAEEKWKAEQREAG